jgi:hypothetical protein
VTDPTADDDHDGVNNLDEFKRGTNPKDKLPLQPVIGVPEGVNLSV